MSRTALGCLLIVLSPVLATGGPASAEGTFPVEQLWRHDLTTLPAELQPEASDEIREVVTREEAVDLALQANRLAKNPERLKFITETVRKAYAGVLDSHGVLSMREDHLNACREVERIVAERAAQAKASPAEVLAAQAALAKATEDVLRARQAALAQTAQLNHLMGRDPQVRLRVRAEPDLVPATALRAGTVTVSGQ